MRPNWPNYPGAYPQPPFPEPPKCPPFPNCATVPQQIRCLYEMIKELADAEGVTLDDTVTQTSTNGVKSSGIWAYGEGIKTELSETIDQIDTEVIAATQDIHNLQTSQTTQDTKIRKLETDLTAAEGSIMDITGDVTALEADVQEVKTKNTEQDAELENLDNKTSEAILHLGERVTTAESDIDTLDQNITDVQNALIGKQDQLAFDKYPVSNSTNPVTSGGIKNSFANLSVVQKSSGNAFAAVFNQSRPLANKVGRYNYVIDDVMFASTNLSVDFSEFLRYTVGSREVGYVATINPAPEMSLYPNVAVLEYSLPSKLLYGVVTITFPPVVVGDPEHVINDVPTLLVATCGKLSNNGGIKISRFGFFRGIANPELIEWLDTLTLQGETSGYIDIRTL